MDTKTVKALEDSITHHEDNLEKLRNLKGEFSKLIIDYHATACALCVKYRNRYGTLVCDECPLSIEGFRCGNENSPWKQIAHADTKSETIKAEENMVRVLKEVLGKYKPQAKFQIGEETEVVEIVSGLDDEWLGKTVTIKGLYKATDNRQMYTVKETDFGWYETQFKKKEKIVMSQYDDLKAQIEAISENTSLKEVDDVMQEIYYPGLEPISYQLIINVRNFRKTEKLGDPCQSIVVSKHMDSRHVIEFPYTSQCEKIAALKKALMYLLDNSDIPKDIIGKEVTMEYEGKKVKARIIKEV